jgi:hypothetical protein
VRIAVVVGVVLAIVGVSRAAHAGCKRGARLFRIESTPIEGGATSVLEVRTSGAWTAGEAKGCLSKPRLAAVRKAVKAAHFRNRVDFDPCDVEPTTNVAYRGTKKHVEGSWPCGRAVDGGTTAAASCVEAAVDSARTDEQVGEECAFAMASAEPFCEGGALLFSRTSTSSSDAVAVTDLNGQDVTPARPTALDLQVRATGAWSRKIDGAPVGGGCLTAPRRKLLAGVVAKARFRGPASRTTCDDFWRVEVEYRGAKKSKRVDTSCGQLPDAATGTAARCLDAMTDGHSSDDQVAEACAPCGRGSSPGWSSASSARRRPRTPAARRARRSSGSRRCRSRAATASSSR